ncbi:hypothetical protein CJ030_MR7G015230 [Morella rubra]|uniref:RNase H type-1 domain-containing protein n=1 Tax=Morella rubra TaxID=262757 RepID=A0A6A1UXU9_9ROSI|nr:hypothetical protein CJ030_MR7G015230 [Morella rubra]
MRSGVNTICRLLQEHEKWSFGWIPREANFAAHNLAKWCINSTKFGEICLSDLPSDVALCDHAGSLSQPP